MTWAPHPILKSVNSGTSALGAVSGLARQEVLFGITLDMQLARKGETQ
jgi:hypothetical protein